MFSLVRIVASNPEKQTADIVLDSKWIGFLEGDATAGMYIRRNVPYVTPIAFDNALPYIWGDMNSKGNKPSEEFNTKREQYGEAFLFGRTYNPAYLKYIHEKYYQKRGTNPKLVTGGFIFRPPEGALALFDRQSSVIVGFLSLSASTSREDTEYTAPTATDVPGFATTYMDKFRETEPKNIIRYAQTSTGFNSTVEIQETQSYANSGNDIAALKIDELTKQDMEASTYPNSSSYVYWRSICPAHVENLTPQYERFKQNDIKRINDVFMLSNSGSYTSNRALKFSPETYASLSSYTYAPLFSNGEAYKPELKMLSTNNFSVRNTFVYPNLVTAEEVEGSSGETAKQFQYPEDVHIAPESGIEHFRTGKIIIYSDITDSFADSNKPLNFEEYVKDDSEFYKTLQRYDTCIEDLKLHIKEFDYQTLSALTDDAIFEYEFDGLNLDTPKIDSVRKIHAYDDRGSYILTDPSYVEISSDTSKGGWLLSKSSKRIDRVREYSKTTVFYPFEIFQQLTEENYWENGSGAISFDKAPDIAPRYEVMTNDNILEGTFGLEAPLIGTKSFRTHHKALRSFSMEVKSETKAIDAGVYLGARDIGGSSDGGHVLIKAGYSNEKGGTILDAQAPPEANQGGSITLSAHEIKFNCNRLLLGQIRLDQNEKMQDLNLGCILLSLIPMLGSAAKLIGTVILNIYPIQTSSGPEDLI